MKYIRDLYTIIWNIFLWDYLRLIETHIFERHLVSYVELLLKQKEKRFFFIRFKTWNIEKLSPFFYHPFPLLLMSTVD